MPTESIEVAVAAPSVAATEAATLASFWWRHARLPLAFVVCLTIAVGNSLLDQSIAHRFFYDLPQHRWIGADNWWINAVLHDGGRWFVRGIVFSSLLLWGATFLRPALHRWRRPSLYFTVTMILAIGIVGLLKITTNVDCPWDLQEFDGHFPYIHLFADRPAALRHARCFPAAHASSGYALMALYFVACERSLRWARSGLLAGLILGLVFGIAQQARGAHFVSHDAWSACITWIVSLSVYAAAFRARIWSGDVH
jgi:membrane-associated PAP2 superfamily phosphatase